eukprot:590149-Amphidinium_carterae.1
MTKRSSWSCRMLAASTEAQRLRSVWVAWVRLFSSAAPRQLVTTCLHAASACCGSWKFRRCTWFVRTALVLLMTNRVQDNELSRTREHIPDRT